MTAENSVTYLGILVKWGKDARNCCKKRFAVSGKFGATVPVLWVPFVPDQFLCRCLFFFLFLNLEVSDPP